MRRSGAELVVVALALLLAGCLYGLTGGGLPPHIKTVAVLPFDNQTASPTLQSELLTQLQHSVESRLGLREASESRADAIVRGRIVAYQPDIPAAYSAGSTQPSAAQRKLEISIDVEIIDQTNGRTIWSQKGMTAEGTYSERAEASGRQQAIETLVNDIIAGAQSQW